MGDQIYQVSVKNKWTVGTSRQYCVVAQPPYVNKKFPDPVELMIPIFYKDDSPAPYDGIATIEFKHKYFAFVGQLKSRGSARAIHCIKTVAVELGSPSDDGSVIKANFKGKTFDIERDEQPGKPSPHETFEIKCGRNPPGGNHYVVGLAQSSVTGNEEEGIPIAAMPYVPLTTYQIKPSGKMCLKVVRPEITVGHILDKDTTIVPIDFSKSSDKVTVTEDDNGKFWSPSTGSRHSLQEFTLHQLLSISNATYSPPRPVHQKQHTPAPARKHKWEDEAMALGFTSIRQVSSLCQYLLCAT